jgi:hypothetical protein
MGWFTFDNILALIVIILILLIVYTKIKNQNLKDTIDEVKEIFVPND